jgi:DNA-binding ferritin-like protein (Dps family)
MKEITLYFSRRKKQYKSRQSCLKEDFVDFFNKNKKVIHKFGIGNRISDHMVRFGDDDNFMANETQRLMYVTILHKGLIIYNEQHMYKSYGRKCEEDELEIIGKDVMLTLKNFLNSLMCSYENECQGKLQKSMAKDTETYIQDYVFWHRGFAFDKMFEVRIKPVRL